MQKKVGEEVLVRHLLENNASLQKASLNLIETSTILIKRIDKLVSIFEDASKHVTDVELNDERLKNLTGRLENLLEQNKEIARGLILLEQYIRSKTPEVPRTQFSQQVPEFKL